MEITKNEYLDYVNKLVAHKNQEGLDNLQMGIFLTLWENANVTYDNLCETKGWSSDTVRHKGAELWKLLSKVTGQKITKRNFKVELVKYLSINNPENKDLTVEGENRQKVKEINDLVNKEKHLFEANASNNNLIAKAETCNNFDLQFYVDRDKEEEALTEISKPGGILRILGKRTTGKTLLLKKLLDKLSNDTWGIEVDLGLVPEANLKDSDLFCRWMCEFLAYKLSFPLPEIDRYWIPSLGGLTSATNYFEKYLLKTIDRPIILAFDNLKELFPYESSAKKIFQMLRAWGDKRSRSQLWRNKFRLILVYRENPLSLEGKHSPFNFGTPIFLSDFNQKEVLELFSKYQLNLEVGDVDKLISEIGSNPYVIDCVCRELSNNEKSINSILKSNLKNQKSFLCYAQK